MKPSVPGADIVLTAPVGMLQARRENPSRFRWSKKATNLYGGLDGLLVRTALVRARDYKAAQRRVGKIKDASQVAALCAHLQHADTEYMVVIAMDRNQKPTAIYEVTEGSANSFHIMPSQIVKVMLLAGSDTCYVVHNHPLLSTGETLRPSQQDRDLTALIQSTLGCVGLHLLDHIIIGAKGFYSFANYGELGGKKKARKRGVAGRRAGRR